MNCAFLQGDLDEQRVNDDDDDDNFKIESQFVRVVKVGVTNVQTVWRTNHSSLQ